MLTEEPPWNMRQWAEAHDKSDDGRFRIVWIGFASALSILVALTGWSLKTQVDTAQAQLAELRETRQQVITTGQQVKQQVQQSVTPATPPGN